MFTYISNQFQTTFKNPFVEVSVNSKEETLKTVVPSTPKNSASVHWPHAPTHKIRKEVGNLTNPN